MGNKTKGKSNQVRTRKKVVSKVIDSTINFNQFFKNQVDLGNLGFWQKSEILVFFKEQGLSENENQDKYQEILKLY